MALALPCVLATQQAIWERCQPQRAGHGRAITGVTKNEPHEPKHIGGIMCWCPEAQRVRMP
eukprot:12791005-Alexandrium_andersonii.AAC.1